MEARDQSEDDSGDIVGDNGDEGCVSGVVSYGTYRGDHVGGPNDEDRGEGGEAAQRPGDNGHKDGSMGTSMRPTATSKGIIGGVDEAAVSAARVLDMVETAGSEGLLQSRRPEEISGPEDESHADVRDVERATTDRVEGQRVDGHARCGGFKMNQSREIPAEEATAGDAKVNSKVPDTRMGIGLDGAERSLGAAPCLPLQLITVELSKARAGLGLSEEWSRRVEKKCGERQKQVRRETWAVPAPARRTARVPWSCCPCRVFLSFDMGVYLRRFVMRGPGGETRRNQIISILISSGYH